MSNREEKLFQCQIRNQILRQCQIRNFLGRILHAWSAVQTEADACMQALVAASNAGMCNICIEFSNLIIGMKSSAWDLAPKGVLFRDLRQFISSNFSTFAYSLVPRTCNKVFFKYW